jgi:hypothetical protein
MVNKPMKPIKYLLLVSMASLTLASFYPTTPAMALSADASAKVKGDERKGFMSECLKGDKKL